ncbi:MAG TPA: NAD(P)H-dependent oxidoreductase subunit E, partial [Candidatus Acidoferrales bacterium]|nr:NAD(P)H-dependent oxidoreductase subunit E [Candidatus Acidoferrales bacterium]
MIFDDLRAIQLRYGFLPKAELEAFSQRSNTPLYQIHSVASFYPHFHLAPPPKADVRVCVDMSCHLNGACELRSELEQRFTKNNATEVQIRDVSCLGRCDHAPAVSINDEIFTNVTAASAETMARGAILGKEVLEPHPGNGRVQCASDPYSQGEKYGVVRKLAATKDWDGVLAELKESELRGMGGAGFPTST